MRKFKKITMTLVALLSMATGAWAQETVTVNREGETNKWTFTMPAGNVELTPVYEPELTAAFKAGNANTIQGSKATVTVKEKDGTTAYTGATLDENGNYKPLYEGQTITLTAKPGYKFKSVEVKKGGAATPSLDLTSPAMGQVIGSDGKNYAYGSLPTGVTAVAKICYVSGSNGLALALTDEGKMNWSTAQTTCAAHTPAFTGGTWKLATKDEWDNMITAAGSYTDLRDGFSSVGGSNMNKGYYRSSTEDGTDYAKAYYFGNIGGGGWFSIDKNSDNYNVRACLAF